MSQPIPDSDEARDEARFERSRQPVEPAKPYGDDDLAIFRERARQGLFSLSGPPARLLATVDMREAERDQARAERDELRQAVHKFLSNRSLTNCPQCDGRGTRELEVDDDGKRHPDLPCAPCQGTGTHTHARHLRTLIEVRS